MMRPHSSSAAQPRPHQHARPHRRQAGSHRRRRAATTSAAAGLDACTVLAIASTLSDGGSSSGTSSYELGQLVNGLVQDQLTGVSPASCAAVLGAGLLTSVSPCTLSVLPLTIGYIGGYGATSHTTATLDSSSSSSSSSSSLGTQALAFSLGLASTLAGLGVVSSSLGGAYGQIGPGLPIAVALVAVLMGFNLLEVVVLPLPSFLANVDVRSAGLPPPLTAYLAGATFALAASPCSSPVLATILAYAATQHSPLAGGVLLFLYSCGYVAPLLAAASATGAAKRLLALRAYSAWVTPASGVLLVAGGTYALLSRLAP